jgi:hypothetical protein
VQTADQMLGQPPSVSGWNDRAWLNTSTFAARWNAVTEITRVDPAPYASYVGKTESPEQALSLALAYWGNPSISQGHRQLLAQTANKTWVKGAPGAYSNSQDHLANRQNTLRQLVAAGPDFQVS